MASEQSDSATPPTASSAEANAPTAISRDVPDDHVPADHSREKQLPLWVVFVALIPVFFVASVIASYVGELVSKNGEREVLASVIFTLFAFLPFFFVPLAVSKSFGRSMRDLYGLRLVLPTDVWKGVCFGVGAHIMVYLMYLPVAIFFPEVANKLDDPAQEATRGVAGYEWYAMFFVLSVLTPIIEETFFRGLTLRAFAQRFGNAWAIVISGTIFGFAHLLPLQAPALIALGLLLGWRSVRTGRLGEVIVIHGTFNFITALMLMQTSG